jgi:hypothetical protein
LEVARRASAAVLGLVVVSLAGCGPEPCQGGHLPIPLVALRADLNTSTLPPEFAFSEQELVAAIRGTWSDAAAGVVLTVEPQAGAEITYATPGDRADCGFSASLPVEGEITAGGAAGPVTGGFLVSGSELSRGGLELRNDEGEIMCAFEYYLADGSPTLDGSCGPPVGSYAAQLVLAKAP